jgi:hypothetical protein
MAGEKDSLQKEDLYLLLESYKNSVEMNTVISQQLRLILEAIAKRKQDTDLTETHLMDKISAAVDVVSKTKESTDAHNVESIKGIGNIILSLGKLSNKVIVLYFAIGTIVASLFWLTFQLIEKYDIVRAIALKLGVGVQ